MKHLKLSFVGLLALAAAAPDTFAQGLAPPPIGGGLPATSMDSGPGGAVSGAVGNGAESGPGGNIGAGNFVAGTLNSGGNIAVDRGALNSVGNVTVFRSGREYYRTTSPVAPARAVAGPAAASSDNASADRYYRSPIYSGNCWNPYYRRYSISFAPCAAYPQ